jgi:hypothetical protein
MTDDQPKTKTTPTAPQTSEEPKTSTPTVINFPFPTRRFYNQNDLYIIDGIERIGDVMGY